VGVCVCGELLGLCGLVGWCSLMCVWVFVVLFLCGGLLVCLGWGMFFGFCF